MSDKQKLLAVLIDGDNVQATLIPQILEKVSDYGKIAFIMVYADSSKAQSKDWQEVIAKYAMKTDFKSNVSTGKNATDIALVIGAMDILYKTRGKLGGFCIISSDSDFTHLAIRIRQDRLNVFGFGREDASANFKHAYDEFITFESLQSQASVNGATPAKTPQPKQPQKPASGASPIEQAVQKDVGKFREAYNLAMQSQKAPVDGWVNLSTLRVAIKTIYPNYNPLIYREQKHSQLLKVVKAMSQDYPKLVQVQQKDKQHLVRIKL